MSPILVQVKLEPPQIKVEQEEMSPILVQVKLEPPQIKEEQEEEILQRPEEAALLAVKSEDGDDENRETEPVAGASTEHMKTQADVEDCGTSQPTGDDQFLSSHCSESDITDDSDDWPSHCSEDSDEWKPSDDQSVLNTLKSHKKTQRVEGQRLSQNVTSLKQTPSTSRTGKKGFYCTECGKVFKRKEHLNNHTMTHTGERPFACSVCSRSFGQPHHLNTHMNTHTGDKPFACSLCSKSFNQSQNLTRHMRSHTGDKPFACTVCSKSFNQSQHLKRHMSTHTGEKPFACSVCEKDYSLAQHLKRHMRTHAGETPASTNPRMEEAEPSPPRRSTRNRRR